MNIAQLLRKHLGQVPEEAETGSSAWLMLRNPEATPPETERS